MNIFFLDTDIKTSAQYHVDKHVVKMRLELAQLACGAHHVTGTNPSIIPYKLTHKNHPSAIWTRESLSNYNYVIELGLALCDELKFRNGTEFQKLYEVFEWLKNNKPNIEDKGFTRPRLAINFEQIGVNELVQKHLNDETDLEWAVNNYRQYYNVGKQHLYAWKNRTKPYWIR